MRRARLGLLIGVLVLAGAIIGVRLVWWQGFLGLVTRARMTIAPTAAEREQDQARRAFAAIDAHDPAALERVVKESGKTDLRASDDETLLLHAIRAGEGAAVRWLVDQGARVTEVPGKPLLRSIPPPSPDELHTLIAAGADPYARDERGESFFSVTFREATVERLAVVLTARPAPKGAWLQRLLWLAARAGRVDQVKILLDAGADPDVSPEGEWAPILEAAHGGQLEVVKELLARPGKRSAATEAMLGAASNDHPEIVAALHAAGTPLPEDPTERQVVEHVLSPAASGPRPSFEELHKPVAAVWDGPLLVQTYLLQQCGQGAADSELPARWADVDLPVSSLGRAEGDEVLALLSDGRAVPARFGKLSCYTGECGQGWYTASLTGVDERDVLAVAPPGFIPARGQASALRKGPGACAPPVPRAPAEGTWQKSCSVWRGRGQTAIEVLEYVAESDDSVQAVRHARLLGETPGPWLDLGPKPELAPVLQIEAAGEAARFVFWRPGRLSTGHSLVCVVRGKPGNVLELGRCFAAGGQPCD